MFGRAMDDFLCLESVGSRGTREADLEDKLNDCNLFQVSRYSGFCPV